MKNMQFLFYLLFGGIATVGFSLVANHFWINLATAILGPIGLLVTAEAIVGIFCLSIVGFCHKRQLFFLEKLMGMVWMFLGCGVAVIMPFLSFGFFQKFLKWMYL